MAVNEETAGPIIKRVRIRQSDRRNSASPDYLREDQPMRQNSRQSRHETMIASPLSARSLSRAAFAIAAIGALAACSADQNLSSSPQSKASSPSQAPSPALVYVSDSS